jgi:hypothetical protein
MIYSKSYTITVRAILLNLVILITFGDQYHTVHSYVVNHQVNYPSSGL